MQNTDYVFQEFLDYFIKKNEGNLPDTSQYFTKEPYYNLWIRMAKSMQEGMLPINMELMINYEILKLARNNITNEQLWCAVLLEKLVYCMYRGNESQIAEIAYGLGSQNLKNQYRNLFEQLLNPETEAPDPSAVRVMLAIPCEE